MGSYDDEKKGGIFPTHTGPHIGTSKARGMLDNIGGSAGAIRTQQWIQPDGSTTRLKTKDGMPEFITEGGTAEDIKPCADYLVEQEKTGDSLSAIKAMLRTNPNELYGKQLGAALFIDSISSTPVVDVATTNVNGLKNFSLPAAEGDTYLVRFPWSKKDILLFGRDRHYCPYPKSSVKVGYLRWPFGTLRDGTKHIFILEARITWSCAAHYFYSPSYTMVEVFDAEHPDVVLKTLMFEGVYGQHVTLNATPDTVHSVLTMTGVWPTMNNFNSDHLYDPIDPQGQLIVEFEATYDGTLHVDSALLFDWGAEGTTHQISATSARIEVPAAYMAPYVVTPTTPIGEGGTFYPILAGYGYNGERRVIYSTQRFEYDPGVGDYFQTVEVFANEALVCFAHLRTPSNVLTAAPASVLANSADYMYYGPTVTHLLVEQIHPVAVTNNCVVFGGWIWADTDHSLPVPHYGYGNFYCAISIEGDVFELGKEELRIFPGNTKTFWYVNTYSDWAKDTNNRNREKYISDPIRAGISWNPISKEFSLHNAVDSTYYDPTNFEWTYLGGSWGMAPATALLGTGFVGTRKKL